MTPEERIVLQNSKLAWRREMRAKHGNTWTKRSASKLQPDGQRRMN